VFFHRAGRLFPPFLLMLGGLAVQADEFQQESGQLEYVQVTATRRSASEFEVSAAVTRIGAGEIEAGSPDVLAEMLRGLPGTFFQQTTAGQGIPVIRGLKGSQVLHLVDGMRINNAFFRNAPNQYLGLVDPLAVESIEVVRGAAGSLYGADAMGGVVNILTPVPEPGGPGQHLESSLYGSYNSADEAWMTRVQVVGGGQDHGFVAGASYQDFSDRKTGNGETLNPSGFRSRAVDAKLVSRINSGSDLMFSIQAMEQPSTPRTDELLPGFGQAEPSSSQFEFMPNRRSFMHGRFRTEAGADWFDKLEIHLARQIISDDRLTQDFGSSIIANEENESVLDGLTVQFDSSPGTGKDLSWGFEFYSDEISSNRRERDSGTGLTAQAQSRFPDGSTMDSMATYLGGEWQHNGQLRLGAGVRYSRYSISLPGTVDSNLVKLEPADFTGDLNLVWSLRPHTRLVANVGRGFRPPNIFDLGTLGPRPGNRFNIANPQLGPESVLSYDLGLKTAAGNWQSEIFVFYMDYRDKITSVLTGDLTQSGRYIVRSDNRGKVSLHGFEAGFRWSGQGGREAYGTLNHTRGKERSAGSASPADRVPPLNGKLGMVFRPKGSLRIDTYLLFAGRQDRLSQRDVSDPRINPAGTPGWATMNVMLGWTANNHMEVGLRFENLADRAYREHGSGIDAPGINIGAWASVSF
jgi:outer membrane receptor protein involved in Fe transport